MSGSSVSSREKTVIIYMTLPEYSSELVIANHYPAIERVLGHLRARLNIPSPSELVQDVAVDFDHSRKSDNSMSERDLKGTDWIGTIQFDDQKSDIDFNDSAITQSPCPRPQIDFQVASVTHFSSASEANILAVSLGDSGGFHGDNTSKPSSQYSHQERTAFIRKLAKEMTPGSRRIYFIAKQLALSSSAEPTKVY